MVKIEKIHKATSLDDALNVLKDHEANVVLGGGVWLKQSTKTIKNAIDLTALKLDKIEEDDDGFTIGSMVTLRDVECHPMLSKLYDGILSQALTKVMGIQLRHTATLGGSIMGRYAFSDVITPLLVMNTRLVFHEKGEVTLEEFLNTRGKMQDILVCIRIKNESASGYFKKVAQTQLSFSVLNIAVSKTSVGVRIAIGSRPSIAMLAHDAMQFLDKTAIWNEAVLDTALGKVLDEIKLSSNTRGSKDYRLNLSKTYVKRGLKAVMTHES